MPPRIRRATGADAATLARLNDAVQGPHAEAHPEVFLPPDAEAAEPEFARWLTDPSWYALIAEDEDGAPVGYAVAHTVSFAANPFVRGMAYTRLDQMAVLPDREGEGVGTALVRAVLDLARDLGHDSVQLNVWAFNERARRLYEHLGFEVFRSEMRVKVDSDTLKNVE